MGLADCARDTVCRVWGQHEGNVIRHQAIRPHLDRDLATALGEEVTIERVVGRLEEYRLKPVAALGHMMGKPGTTIRPMRAMRAWCRGRKTHATG
jgi:hypothetical protein